MNEVLKTKAVTLVGAGRLGTAILKRLLDCGYTCTVLEHRQANLDRLPKHSRCHGTLDTDSAISKARVVIICIKPAGVLPFLDKMRSLLKPESWIISMAAGVSLASMSSRLGCSRLVRAMPTVSVAVGAGILACCPHEESLWNKAGELKALMACLGQVVCLEEHHWSLFTAVVGSGPAFFAKLLQDVATKVAKTYEVDADQVGAWLQSMCGGTLRYLEEASLSPEGLIHQVKAPKGTTEAGLLAGEGVSFDWFEAIKGAYEKADALDCC